MSAQRIELSFQNLHSFYKPLIIEEENQYDKETYARAVQVYLENAFVLPDKTEFEYHYKIWNDQTRRL
jgi:hypothetical protein